MRTSSNPLAVQSQSWIFHAFTGLLRTMPYDEITVSLLCRHAEIDRRTFYRYFDNKKDVLCSCMDQVFNEYMERARRLENPSAADYLRLFFRFWQGDYRDFLMALQQGGLLYAAFTAQEKYLTEISRLLDEMLGRSSGHYEIMYRAGGLVSVLSSWADSGFSEPAETMAAVISGLIR